ncbi:hypothetical protein QYE76_007003 [Lolium multiflorum]|uniref:Uncharacterized protein n=1 Tax=Lolium multiflorum TaxID=4521 RepID=A0AAD8W4N3_LOLMU|nr:hypothetical protein QYE76_007003 [Lolium multiflorum]
MATRKNAELDQQPKAGCLEVAAYCRDKLENELLPLFAHMASTGTSFDMQEMITRFMFDLNSMMVLGVNPGLLSPEMPAMDVATAMDMVMEVGFFRHMMPVSCWKVMRWLNIGVERKLNDAQKVLRAFVVEIITEWRKIKGASVGNDEGVEDILSAYIDDPDFDDDLLHATLFNSMLAGRDTIRMALLWLLYNISQNPDIMPTIRNELSDVVSRKVAGGMCVNSPVIFEPEETKSLVYLRAAIYETLRMYPPGPFERKTVAADDILPSGHKVHVDDTIIISLYSMGRMEGLWGKDCLDYNPNRWLSEDRNKLRYIPSHKFLAFSSGPRMCVGKEISIMQIKTIVAAVVWNFDIEVVEGQIIQPKLSCILQMENGLKVMLKKRNM